MTAFFVAFPAESLAVTVIFALTFLRFLSAFLTPAKTFFESFSLRVSNVSRSIGSPACGASLPRV